MTAAPTGLVLTPCRRCNESCKSWNVSHSGTVIQKLAERPFVEQAVRCMANNRCKVRVVNLRLCNNRHQITDGFATFAGCQLQCFNEVLRRPEITSKTLVGSQSYQDGAPLNSHNLTVFEASLSKSFTKERCFPSCSKAVCV